MSQNTDLAMLRHSRGFSQKRLAEAIDINRATLSRWEKGERSIPLDIAVRIASALTGDDTEHPITERMVYDAWVASQQVAAITPKQQRKPRTRPPDPAIAA